MDPNGYKMARKQLSVLVDDYWKLKSKHTRDGKKLDQLYVNIVNMTKDLNEINRQRQFEKEENLISNVKK